MQFLSRYPSVALGVLMNKENTVRQAGGFIIQLMPFAEEEVIQKLEERIAALPSITTLLEAEKHTGESILTLILGDMGLTFHDTMDTNFYCNCTKERVEKAIVSIGKKEIQEMIDENETIEVNCHFCSTKYHFSQ